MDTYGLALGIVIHMLMIWGLVVPALGPPMMAIDMLEEPSAE